MFYSFQATPTLSWHPWRTRRQCLRTEWTPRTDVPPGETATTATAPWRHTRTASTPPYPAWTPSTSAKTASDLQTLSPCQKLRSFPRPPSPHLDGVAVRLHRRLVCHPCTQLYQNRQFCPGQGCQVRQCCHAAPQWPQSYQKMDHITF